MAQGVVPVKVARLFQYMHSQGIVILLGWSEAIAVFALWGRLGVPGKGWLSSDCDAQSASQNLGLGRFRAEVVAVCMIVAVIILGKSSARYATSAVDKQVWGKVVGKSCIIIIVTIRQLLA